MSENLHIATGILDIASQRVNKISDVTKADFFQLNLSRIHGKIEREWCGVNSGSVSNPVIR